VTQARAPHLFLDEPRTPHDTNFMGDGALWIAALTGGTAVLASWVTSRGNTRAARVQAEASAHAQHRIKARELRRTAYLELIEQAHLVGELSCARSSPSTKPTSMNTARTWP
jgi:hypothetical protein